MSNKPYYARSIINGLEIANEIETIIGEDRITIKIADTNTLSKTQINIRTLIQKVVSGIEIKYNLKASGINLPTRRANIVSYKKIEKDDLHKIEIKLK